MNSKETLIEAHVYEQDPKNSKRPDRHGRLLNDAIARFVKYKGSEIKEVQYSGGPMFGSGIVAEVYREDLLRKLDQEGLAQTVKISANPIIEVPEKNGQGVRRIWVKDTVGEVLSAIQRRAKDVNLKIESIALRFHVPRIKQIYRNLRTKALVISAEKILTTRYIKERNDPRYALETVEIKRNKRKIREVHSSWTHFKYWLAEIPRRIITAFPKGQELLHEKANKIVTKPRVATA